ncbi:MAG: mobile mystery protein A [Burkholderiaceae bacterium]
MKRLQLTDALRPFAGARSVRVPPGGWLHAMREALGITQAQLARRLNISRQSVQDFERAEAEGRITLESLQRVARALDCRLVYAVIPENGSLHDIRMRQAEAVADRLLQPTGHSMKLEAQGVSERERKRQRKLLVESLLRESPRKLWE